MSDPSPGAPQRCSQCGDSGLVRRDREVVCPACHGTGKVDEACGNCGGDGWAPEPTRGAPSIGLLWGSLLGLCTTLMQMGDPRQIRCEACGGSGKVTRPCRRCGGTGRTTETTFEPCSACSRGRQIREQMEAERRPAFRARR